MFCRQEKLQLETTIAIKIIQQKKEKKKNSLTNKNITIKNTATEKVKKKISSICTCALDRRKINKKTNCVIRMREYCMSNRVFFFSKKTSREYY